MMREAGAREVHFRISSPPITHPDYYGIDTPVREKLLAATHTLDEMRRLYRLRIRWRSSRSTASIAPWAKKGAIRCGRNSPTIASPAIIRPTSPIISGETKSQLSLLAEAS